MYEESSTLPELVAKCSGELAVTRDLRTHMLSSSSLRVLALAPSLPLSLFLSSLPPSASLPPLPSLHHLSLLRNPMLRSERSNVDATCMQSSRERYPGTRG
eukprot:2339786-Rhodomonas_salina.1